MRLSWLLPIEIPGTDKKHDAWSIEWVFDFRKEKKR